MAKVNVCDVCKSEGKLMETNKYMSVKKRPNLRIDICEEHKKILPKGMVEYVQFVYKMKGIELTEEAASNMLK